MIPTFRPARVAQPSAAARSAPVVTLRAGRPPVDAVPAAEGWPAPALAADERHGQGSSSGSGEQLSAVEVRHRFASQ